MIAKILKGGSAASKVDYVLREKHDKEKYTPDTWKILGSRGLMGEKRDQIVASFEAQQMQNPKISKPTGHITLSFSEEDKRKLTDEKMRQIAEDYIKKMGLDKTQWLLVRHYETDKPHCHIVFNMVGDDKKRVESGRNRYRSKRVCEALNKKYRLAPPKQLPPDLEKLHGVERAKAEIRLAATEALKTAKDWNSFTIALMRKNIRVIPKYRKGTTIQEGVSFQMGDYKVKGSDLGDNFKFRNLNRYFNQPSPANRTTTPQPRVVAAQPTNEPSIADMALKMTQATAEVAADVATGIGEGVSNLIGGLFQPGNGELDENEKLEAWKLTHPKKKKTGKSLKA